MWVRGSESDSIKLLSKATSLPRTSNWMSYVESQPDRAPPVEIFQIRYRWAGDVSASQHLAVSEVIWLMRWSAAVKAAVVLCDGCAQLVTPQQVRRRFTSISSVSTFTRMLSSTTAAVAAEAELAATVLLTAGVGADTAWTTGSTLDRTSGTSIWASTWASTWAAGSMIAELGATIGSEVTPPPGPLRPGKVV